MFPKNQTRKKFELCQNALIFTKAFELYQMKKLLDIHKRFQGPKCPNTLKLYTLKPVLCKNLFYFFLLIFCHANISSSFRIPRYWD